jgi:hypothetical protein
MTPLTLAKLVEIATLLVTGRTSVALQRLMLVIRENGGPDLPTTDEASPPPPQPQTPVWMRPSA